MKISRKLDFTTYIVRATACLAAVVFTCTAARSFEGKLGFDQALAAQTAAKSIPLLQLSARRNPDDAQTILKLSDALLKAGDAAGALRVLESSSIGTNHWQGWQRQGVIWKEKANGTAGGDGEAKKAAVLFERVIRVHPYYTPALEHRCVLALKLHDWTKAAAIADDLEQLDYNNLSANYLRAQLAAQLGETTKALTLLRRLSDQRGYPSSLFNKQTIQVQIKAVESELKL